MNAGTLQTGAEYALSPSSDVMVGGNGVLDMNGFDNQINTLSGTGSVENSAAGTSVTLGVGVDDTAGQGGLHTIFSGALQERRYGPTCPR